jgi:C4-dicarboxylate-specific signal transduction histidine kinase
MEDILRNSQLKFIGKLMAGVSHEFKNHLAIINESSGLMDDLLQIEDTGLQNPERFLKITKGIEDRVAEAALMSRHVNTFSHRMDEPCASFDVNAVLQEEVSLLQRFARQQNTYLEMQPGQNLPTIYNNPSLFQFVVFCLLEPTLDYAGSNSRILISTEKQETAVKVTVDLESSKGSSDKTTKALVPDVLPYALEKLTAQLFHESPGQGRDRATLILPSIDRA